jgi:hypothetical protein
MERSFILHMFFSVEDDMLDWDGSCGDVGESFGSSLDPEWPSDDGNPLADPVATAIPPSVVSAQVCICPLHAKSPQWKGVTVLGRIRAITGADPTQAALIALRRGLFKDILPELSRPDKRKKNSNIATIEKHRAQLLPLFDTKDGIDEVFKVVLDEMKRTAHRNEVLMNRYGIH